MQKRFMSLTHFRKTKSYISFCVMTRRTPSLAFLLLPADGQRSSRWVPRLMAAVDALLTRRVTGIPDSVLSGASLNIDDLMKGTGGSTAMQRGRKGVGGGGPLCGALRGVTVLQPSCVSAVLE